MYRIKRSKREVDELIIKYGNAFNAYTSKDHTCYHITTTSDFYKEALVLLGELVFENKITSEAFARERGVILREIEKSKEEPDSYLHRLTCENLYKVSTTIMGNRRGHQDTRPEAPNTFHFGNLPCVIRTTCRIVK